MKNLLVILMALALIGSASAWGLADSENPYTFSTPGNLKGVDGWNTWGGDAGGSGSVVVSSGQCTLTTGSYELAFNHDNDLTDIGVIAGTDKIELVVSVVSISAANAIVKIEQFPTGASFPNPDNGTGAIAQDLWDPPTNGPDPGITGPGVYSFVTAAPADASAVAVTPVIGVANGTLVIDEIWIGKEGDYPGGAQPSNPTPANDAVVPTNSVSSLSWTNPDPINGTDPLGVSVKFDIEPGVGIYDPNDNNVSTGGGTDIETIALSTMTNPPTSPLPDGYYSWQVIITDPNSPGVPVVTVGPVWLFEVGDAPPVPGQPVNQYMWLSQDDSAIPGGDGPSNVRYFSVTASYTDDGKSPITDANFLNLGWGWDPDGADDILGNEDDQRGVSLVSETWTPGAGTHTSGSVTAIYKTEYNAADPNYSTDIMGYWDIQLQVTDGTGLTQGTAGHHEIWDFCGEAAASNPSDTFDGKYDVNQDCINDIDDFAAFAEKWLNQSVKYE